MKKSIIVMMVAVLLISALFVSCKQEIATPQDSLGTVQVSLPSSRTLTPGTPTSNIPEVTNWYYVAHKESGYYNTGEENWGNLAAMASGQQVGNKFSAGLWTFSFYGYASAKAEKPDDPTTGAIYYTTVSNFEVKGQDEPNYIDVTLQGGAIPAANVTFKNLNFGNVSLPDENFKIFINDIECTFDSTTRSYTFSKVGEGDQTYVVKVKTSAGELVGEAAPVTIAVSKGYDYTISGEVDPTESFGIVVIRKVEYQKTASQSKNVTSGDAVTFNTFVAPDGSETSVAFGTDSGLAGDITLTTKVSGSESAGAFVIENVGSSVASIDLSLSGSATSFSGTATVTTYIAKGLSGVHVYYNDPADTTDYFVSYNSSTGELIFSTTHFSQFVVVSSDEIIVSDGTVYATLAAFATAVNGGKSFAGKTVYLMKDVPLSGAWTPIGNGHRYQSNQNVFSGTFDGKEHTISGLNSNGFDPEISVVDDNEYTYGLFGYVKNGTVRNVILEDVSISQAANYQLENAGGVVGYLDGGKVENCAVSGSVRGYNGIGGVVGRAYGTCTIQNCTNSAAVYGKKNVAGIVGFVNPLHNGTIKVLTNTNDGNVERTAVSGKEGAGAAAGIACYGCSDKVPGASGSVYITGNTNTGYIEDVGGDREGAIHYLTSHDKNTTTGPVVVQ